MNRGQVQKGNRRVCHQCQLGMRLARRLRSTDVSIQKPAGSGAEPVGRVAEHSRGTQGSGVGASRCARRNPRGTASRSPASASPQSILECQQASVLGDRTVRGRARCSRRLAPPRWPSRTGTASPRADGMPRRMRRICRRACVRGASVSIAGDRAGPHARNAHDHAPSQVLSPGWRTRRRAAAAVRAVDA